MTSASNLSNAISLIEEGQVIQATQAISQCLEDESSSKKLSQYGEKMKELKGIEVDQKEFLKEIIKGYVALKDEKETCMSHDQSNDAFAEEMAEAQNTRAKYSQKQSEFQQELQAVQRELDHLADLQATLESHKVTVKEQTTEVLPKTRYNVNLYLLATKLIWDHNCQPDEVRGYISTSKDVRPFSMDNRQNSRFFITNYLWDLIVSATP